MTGEGTFLGLVLLPKLGKWKASGGQLKSFFFLMDIFVAGCINCDRAGQGGGEAAAESGAQERVPEARDSNLKELVVVCSSRATSEKDYVFPFLYGETLPFLLRSSPML